METLHVDKDKKDDFRDHISTVDKDGKRIWVYPKKPSGPLTNARIYVSYVLYAIFFTLPFIKVNGEPLLLFNFAERKFILFSLVFWPQDFHLFLLAMITFTVFIVLFTAIYGRVFCGWICPQTIFMELLFRRIEYWIEGDYKSQQLLDKAPLSSNKFYRKLAKHTIFVIISFIISNIFLMYIIGVDDWVKILHEPINQHTSGLISLIVFTGIFYWVFARFREQVCTTVCPYGRLQGVLLDKNSIVVAYDYVRGEGRAKVKKGEDRAAEGKGDCIDCNQCVNVCPTGIDIRNGTQLECINCTACIDACNFMMDKVGLPKGLIRYDSEEGIAKKQPFRLTKRIWGYSAVLVILVISLISLLVTRADTETTILRTPGSLYQETAGGISNIYNLKIINKTHKNFPVDLKIIKGDGELKLAGGQLLVKNESITSGSFLITIPKNDIHKLKTKLKIGVYSNGQLLEEVNTTFIGPVN